MEVVLPSNSDILLFIDSKNEVGLTVVANNPPREWVGVDLHVHTPASQDYKGNRDDSEYVQILVRANEFAKAPSGATQKNRHPDRPIGCIAFTDHNSVEGYRTLRRIIAGKAALRDSLRSADPGNAFIGKLDAELKDLASVRVIMGVEVNANPGIHLLFIFHESVEPDAVAAFLSEIYEKNYDEIAGNPDPITSCTLLAAMDAAKSKFGDKMFIVAPHVDSSRGEHTRT